MHEDELKHAKAAKNWKKILVISFTVIFVIAILLFMTGMRIRFAIRDSLIVNLSPADQSLTITNQETQPITFDVSTENSRFCTASCSYGFYDRSGDVLLDQGTFTIKRNEKVPRTYTLTPRSRGTGQKIYNFEVQCQNLKSFLCLTKQPLRQKFSFITLNYQLSPEEEEIKNRIKPDLQKDFASFNDAAGNLQVAEHLLEGLLDRGLVANLTTLQRKLNFTLQQTDELFEFWSNEDYFHLDDFYGKSLRGLTLYEDSVNFLNDVRRSRVSQNDLVSSSNSIKHEILNKTTILKYMIYHSSSNHSIGRQFNATFAQLAGILSNVSTYRSLASFSEALNNLSDAVQAFNLTLTKLTNETWTEGDNLAAAEFAKKCGIGICENRTHDPCYDLRILSEFEATEYPLPETLPQASYYQPGENTVRILGSEESSLYFSKFCLNTTAVPDYPGLPDLNQSIEPGNISILMPIQNELSQNLPVCCVRGVCSTCCTTEECRSDPSSYPVILIHGHSLLRSSPEPVIDTFSRIQYQLQEDGYLNGGTIRFDFNHSDFSRNEWGLTGTPLAVKASYYYDYFYSLGKYIYLTRSGENLDTYALRLKDIIELVKFRTGRAKVNLIAHSMGGLVSRRYLQIFGEDSVDKMILIATPNRGITGSAKRFCSLFGEKRECQDMYADSILLSKLNDPTNSINRVQVATISGIGCDTDGELGDGIVTIDNSKLPNVQSFIIEGSCNDTFKRGLHSDLLNIDTYPEVYRAVSSILLEPEPELGRGS